MKKLYILTLLLFIFVCKISAQGRQDYLKVANDAFNKGYYTEAIKYYEQILSDGSDSSQTIYPFGISYRGFGFITLAQINEVSYNLALCYKNIHDYINAEKQFSKAKALNEKTIPLAQFYYGQALLANEKYLQAADEFNEYLSRVSEIDPKYIEANVSLRATDFALEGKKRPEPINIARLEEPVNGNLSSFNPVFNAKDNYLTYTGTEAKNIQIDTSKSEFEEENLKSKYLASIFTVRVNNDSTFDVPEKEEIPARRGFNVGSATFSKDRTLVFYVQWKGNFIDGEYNIYYAKKEGNVYSKAQKLNGKVNDGGSININPFWDEATRRLYFSSNRKPSIGGFDIWYVDLDENMVAGKPFNLGNKINTASDEITPFYQNKTLYFSTNGRVGFGGHDIFKTKNVGDTAWTSPENLGYPINSSRDDAYYALALDETRAFFASDRGECFKCEGSVCYNIYKYRIPKNVFKGRLLDLDSKEILPFAVVKLYDEINKNEIASTKSDENGNFSFEITEGKKYRVEGTADGYLSNKYEFETPTALRPGKNYISDIELEKQLGYTVLVVDAETLEPIDGAEVSILNRTKNELLKKEIANNNGILSVVLNKGLEFSFTGRKEGYLAGTTKISTSGKNDNKEIRILINKIIFDKPIEVKNIFYDFGKATLRKESETGLDSLVQILRDNPSIKIELGAHTDSRGSEVANLKLSEDRAKSVVNFLLRKGITRTRLTSKGYGETIPVAPNENADGTDNPDGRQQNRRTEFKILK